MTSLAVLQNLLKTDIFYNADLRYCFVDENKRPIRVDSNIARPNCIDDFVDFDEMAESEHIKDYIGIGISIQASNVCAIDVDDCFSKKFDIESADERAKDVIKMFKDTAYIEFSFSGKGLRVIFRSDVIEDYSLKYYIKNDKNSIEYYQPSGSYRYVTVTGMTIAENQIRQSDKNDKTLRLFLDKYMRRPVILSKVTTSSNETRSLEELLNVVKHKIMSDVKFQDLWFAEAPGSGKNESQLDFHLLAVLYESVTQDKDMLREIFELSPYYKSKDQKHVHKWLQNNHRYYDYVYNQIVSRKS